MKAKFIPLLFALGVSLATAQTSTVPNLLSYQGRVTDSSGTLIGSAAPVNRSVQFRIYNVSSGGTALYAEAQTVTISGGEFSVLIGNGSGITGLVGPSSPATMPYKSINDILNAATSAAIYLGITVDDGNSATVDLEISPRQQMVTGAFAFRARVAETVASSAVSTAMIGDSAVTTNKIIDAAVSSAKIIDQAVTSAKIADGTIATADVANNAITASKLDATTIGTWTPNGSNVYRSSGNVGIGESSPGFPLNFGFGLGDKISLWANSGACYGFGIQNSTLQIHSDGVSSDVSIGYGPSASMTETMRVKGNGNVGIGTGNPTAKLQVNGGIAASANSVSHSQGVSLEWNKSGGTGESWILNQKGGGTGGIAFGEVDTGNTVTERMRIDSNGNLGIGSSNPANNKLTIRKQLGSDDYSAYQHNFQMEIQSGLGAYGTKSMGVGLLDNGKGVIQVKESGIGYNDLLLNPVAGNVGIGTGTPAVPLDVASYANLTMYDDGIGHNNTQSGTNYTLTNAVSGGRGIEVYSMDGTGAWANNYSVTGKVGIRSQYAIATATQFLAYSDRRIKCDLHPSPTANDLALIEKLQATNYRMVDPDAGTDWKKGFIAQELEKVIPQAVSRSTEFVPEIMSVATTSHFNAADKTLALTLPKDHALQVGDKVRLHLDGHRLDLIVSAVPSPRELVMQGCDKEPLKVLVYGKQVNDFRTVDYDRVFTTGIGAIQELSKKLSEKEARIAQLEARLSALEKLIPAAK